MKTQALALFVFFIGTNARADLFIAFSQGISLKEASRISQEIDNAAKRKDKSLSVRVSFASGTKPRKPGSANPISLYCPENKPDEKGNGCELSVRAPSEMYMTISSPVERDNVAAKMKQATAKMAEFESKKSTESFEIQGLLGSGDASMLECEAEQKSWDCSIHVSQDVRR